LRCEREENWYASLNFKDGREWHKEGIHK
jgi:hypothetical protein